MSRRLAVWRLCVNFARQVESYCNHTLLYSMGYGVFGIVSGILAGYIASRLQKGKGSGCIVNLFLGIIGGLVGGWLFSLFGLGANSWVGEMVVSVIGAVVVLWVFSRLK